MLNSNDQINSLFKGRFFKVAESKETMLDKKTGEVNYYYSIVLSNGVKTFGCTCTLMLSKRTASRS